MKTEEFWSGAFGDEYVQRNQIQWELRVPFWLNTMNRTMPESVLEVGCNIGSNLRAIEQGYGAQLRGVEINDTAIAQAHDNGLMVAKCSVLELGLNCADLVFTCGVLIHVSQEDLKNAMQHIINAANRWVIAIEYEAEEETEVKYRGHDGKLWKRPFGKLYEDMGLTLWHKQKLTKEQGFDDCTCWTLEIAQ